MRPHLAADARAGEPNYRGVEGDAATGMASHGAISALNSGEPFMSSRPDSPLARSVLDFARAIDKVTVAAAVPART